MTAARDYRCPKCGRGFRDMDGVGFVACRGRWGCGFCIHPSRTGGQCDICGDFAGDGPCECGHQAANWFGPGNDFHDYPRGRCHMDGCTCTVYTPAASS